MTDQPQQPRRTPPPAPRRVPAPAPPPDVNGVNGAEAAPIPQAAPAPRAVPPLAHPAQFPPQQPQQYPQQYPQYPQGPLQPVQPVQPAPAPQQYYTQGGVVLTPDHSAPAPAYAPMAPAHAPVQTPAPAPAPVQAPAPVRASMPDMSSGEVPERDRIVVIGRRQSGKTIYLASIYAQLWKSRDGITAKALSGDVHKQLMTVHQVLQAGKWPPSTLGTSQIDLEIDYHGKRRLLVSLDFAGELFAKAFLEDQHDWPGVKELCNHIDRAAAVLLLIDPSVAAGMDRQAAMEDDFGMVQAVQRIRNWPGGDSVPIVLVLTKMDQNQQLLDRSGGAMEFLRQHFPALLRLIKQLPVVQISCVQSETGPDGKLRPKPESTPVNLDHPLRFCLREIEKSERRSELDKAESMRRAAEARAISAAHSERMRVRRMVTMGVSAISVVGTVLVGLILYYKI